MARKRLEFFNGRDISSQKRLLNFQFKWLAVPALAATPSLCCFLQGERYICCYRIVSHRIFVQVSTIFDVTITTKKAFTCFSIAPVCRSFPLKSIVLSDDGLCYMISQK